MQSEKINNRYIVILLLCLVIIGGFLRFWNVGVPSLWVDEANTVYAAKSVLETGQDTMPSGMIYTRARLYTYIVAFFYKLLGVTEATTRYPSVLFGILSILLAYAVGKRIFDTRVGLLTAFLITFSHFQVGWSRTGRTYALLQLFTLLIVFCFLRGFEKKNHEKKKYNQKKSTFPFLLNSRRFFNNKAISLPWLFLCFVLIAVSSIYVHLLTLFILIGLGAYLLFLSVRTFFGQYETRKIFNKYFIASVMAIVFFLVCWIAFPFLREKARYFISYTPPWALRSASAGNKMFLFEFLISPWRFPLAAFFFVGAVQLITRKNKLGWVSMLTFIVPVVLLSFVFTHRVPAYLFFVYPFFLTIVSFGFINLLDRENKFLEDESIYNRKWMRAGVLSLFFLIFIFPPWLRITLNIPFNEDGVTNMAVTPDEWREACRLVKERQEEGDLILSSLPQSAYFYGVQSDYGLNWANYAKAVDENFKNTKGEWIDVYVGVPCIESLDILKKIVQNHPRGWILVSQYHLANEIHIPIQVKEYLGEYFEKKWTTKNGTVFIYHWSRT